MISGLIDELNKSADEWNASNMFELARMCREAADTICELRDDLQRANDAVRDAEHDESRAWDRVRKAENDNAKLRELLLDVWNDAMQFDGFWDYVNDDGEIYNEDELPHYYDRMRELGLEVK